MNSQVTGWRDDSLLSPLTGSIYWVSAQRRIRAHRLAPPAAQCCPSVAVSLRATAARCAAGFQGCRFWPHRLREWGAVPAGLFCHVTVIEAISKSLLCSAHVSTLIIHQQVELWFRDGAEDTEGDSAEMPPSKRLAELRKVIDTHLEYRWWWSCFVTVGMGSNSSLMDWFYKKKEENIRKQLYEPLRGFPMTQTSFSSCAAVLFQVVCGPLFPPLSAALRDHAAILCSWPGPQRGLHQSVEFGAGKASQDPFTGPACPGEKDGEICFLTNCELCTRSCNMKGTA